MPIPPHERSADAEAARAAAERDAGVRRVRSATRWLLAGAVGLTGALAGVVAQQSAPAKASPSGEATTGQGYDDGSRSESEYEGVPQAPAQAPQSAPQSTPPAASSGAS